MLMPFGLVNALATLEQLRERVPRSLIWDACLVYLDDILLYRSGFDTTLGILGRVLDQVKVVGLNLKASKYQIFFTRLRCIGHTMSEAGIS